MISAHWAINRSTFFFRAHRRNRDFTSVASLRGSRGSHFVPSDFVFRNKKLKFRLLSRPQKQKKTKNSSAHLRPTYNPPQDLYFVPIFGDGKINVVLPMIQVSILIASSDMPLHTEARPQSSASARPCRKVVQDMRCKVCCSLIKQHADETLYVCYTVCLSSSCRFKWASVPARTAISIHAHMW